MLTNLQLGARVRGPGDADLGKIQYLVADPKTNQVTHLVVEKGLVGSQQKVVGVNFVREVSGDGKTLWLTLSQHDLDQQPDFIDKEYTSPGTQGAGGTVPSPDLLTSPVGYLYPVDVVAQTVFFPSQERLNVPGDSLLIKEGEEVEARDGKLGRIKRVNLNSVTGKIESFVIEKGLFFKEEYTIPVSLVESAMEDIVYLKVNKEVLVPQSSDDNQPPTNPSALPY